MCIHSSIKSKQKLIIIYANLSGEIKRDFSILSWSLVSKEAFSKSTAAPSGCIR